MTGDPQLLFHILKVKCLRLYAKNNMNFYQAVFPEQNFLENIHKKSGFWGTNQLIFTLSVESYG